MRSARLGAGDPLPSPLALAAWPHTRQHGAQMRSQAVDRKCPSLGPAEQEGGVGDGEKGGNPWFCFFLVSL